MFIIEIIKSIILLFVLSLSVTGQPEIKSFCQNSTNMNCSTKKEATETDKLRLWCEIEAWPEAEVKWTYLGTNSSNPNGTLDTAENRMIDFRNGTLEIRALKRSDTGFYMCYANNSQGYDSAVMHLRVKGRRQRKLNAGALLRPVSNVELFMERIKLGGLSSKLVGRLTQLTQLIQVDPNITSIWFVS